MNSWKTIITYLIDSTPSWIKTVEFSNRLIKWLSIPRKDFKESLKRKELDNSWVYFLLWEDENWDNLAYIWQATILWKRLNDHYKNTEKDFWNYAVAFTYKDWTLNESDINYLEKKIIWEADDIWRYKIINWTSWNNWLIQEYRVPDMNEFIEDLKILLSNLWFNVLKELINKKELKDESNIYYLTSRWSNCKWIYSEEWFIVLKWSKISPKEVIPYQRDLWYIEKNRKLLVEQWVVLDWIFILDHVFKTPTSACNIIAWWNQNGWIEWKNKDWKTLYEIERKDLNSN